MQDGNDNRIDPVEHLTQTGHLNKTDALTEGWKAFQHDGFYRRCVLIGDRWFVTKFIMDSADPSRLRMLRHNDPEVIW